ncbi:TPA: hypothetical protein U8203_002416 [Pseudomonas putida]|jgi:nitroreductase|nr:hypothetical protein [Pseudomonas putida]HEN8717116.1 hypothetical protein [Pseudomonas putida]
MDILIAVVMQYDRLSQAEGECCWFTRCLMASNDATLAAQNASLAADSMGLGIVYLGVMRNAAKEDAEIINLPVNSSLLSVWQQGAYFVDFPQQ